MIKDQEIVEYTFDEENHIHKFTGKPLLGTTTVCGVIAKPLTWWASGLACEKFGWLPSKKKIGGKYVVVNTEEERQQHAVEYLNRIRELPLEEYMKLLDEAYKAHSVKLNDSADSGTDLHAILEKYVKSCIYNNNKKPLAIWDSGIEEKVLKDKIEKFVNWAYENIEEFVWSELHCYSHSLWLGGISDVGIKLKNGKVGILDFKSAKESYETHFIQCGGYDLQISENGGFTSNGYKILNEGIKFDFYAIVPFGADEFTVDFRYNVDELKEAFKSALVIYKLLNK